MPGPRNIKKKARQEAKKARRSQGCKPLDDHHDASELRRQPPVHDDQHLHTQANLVQEYRSHDSQSPDAYHDPDLALHQDAESALITLVGLDELDSVPPSLITEPFIYDPGNGPRVRNVSAFLSSFFASPPTLDDPLCAEFAQEEMLEMLLSVLPEETALILWYNKSRKTARVCPACQRLYRLGDVLPEHLLDENSNPMPDEPTAPNLLREQELSGLCSPMCFVLAAFNYPGTIRSTWGRMAEELDADTWDLLDGPGTCAADNDRGLGMLLKMTRCADLGLGEMFFPDDDTGSGDEEGYVEGDDPDEDDCGVETDRRPTPFDRKVQGEREVRGRLVRGTEVLSTVA